MAKNKVSDQTKAVILAALSEYFKNERIEFKVLSVKPIHSSDINLWGIMGRNRGMALKKIRKGGWK